MPRRNHRVDTYEPLDLTPPPVSAPAGPRRRPGDPPKLTPPLTYRERERREREQQERQTNARLNRGIDWDVCLVPGCGESLTRWGSDLPHDNERDHRFELPLCYKHLAVAARQADYRGKNPLMLEAAAAVIERSQQRQQTRREAAKKAWLKKTDGHIYYVRLNGLIKVGWTRDLADRLKAYGPDVEVLCHYPATHDDETLLHRQLRPFLAKGREWYQDCQLIADMVAKSVAAHGPPRARALWTEPRPGPVGTRPAARAKKSGLSIV